MHAGDAPSWRDSCCSTSAHIQEEDAEYANRQGYSKHAPALPLYTERGRASARSSARGRSPSASGSALRGRRRARASARRPHPRLGASSSSIVAPGRGRQRAPVLRRRRPLRRAARSATRAARPAATCWSSSRPTATASTRRRADRATQLESAARAASSRARRRAAGAGLRRGARAGAALPPARSSMRAGRIPRCRSPRQPDGDRRDRDLPPLPRGAEPRARAASPAATPALRRQLYLHPHARGVEGAQRHARAARDHLGQRHGTGGRVLHHLRRRLPDPQQHGPASSATRRRARAAARCWTAPTRCASTAGTCRCAARIAAINGLSAHADADELCAGLGPRAAPARAHVRGARRAGGRRGRWPDA